MFQDKYVFAQLTAFLNRTQFNNYVRKYDGNRYVKHFTCWNQLLAMMFGQLSNRESLRDLIVAFEAHRAKQYHLTVNLPSHEDLLGDKLTAFAPHTTGIPFFKDEKNCSMEINKQLFDIASLFELTNDLTITTKTFRKFATIELAYRHLPTENLQQVLDDIFYTSLSMTLQGFGNAEEYKLLIDGMKRVRGFIHSEKYTLESAIANASKAAYLSKLIEREHIVVNHFSPDNVSDLIDAEITAPLPARFNKLKKTNIEAFYYWIEIQKMM